MEKLYNYLFHFNHLTGYWAAFKRDDKEKYFNNRDRSDQTKILFAKDINTLVDILTK